MKKENIANLTSLWKIAGNSMNSYSENPEFEYSIVANSEWPNRIWFNKEIKSETLSSVKNFMSNDNLKITVPYWGNNISNEDELFDSLVFSLKFKQIGMSMKLENKFDFEKRLSIEQISNEEEAQIWEDIYPHAFGYKISKGILISTKEKIKYYLAFLNNEPIGTAIVYNTKNVSGIHGVGVIPSARRKGFAEEIMKHVLNESIDAGMEYSTLQASDMGKGIYLRLGYQEDFEIKNYILRN